MTSFENSSVIKIKTGKSVACRRCKSWDGKNDPLLALATNSKDTPHSFRSGVLLKGREKHFSKAASDVIFTAKTVKALNRLRSDSSLLKNYDVGDLESEMQSLRKKSHQLNEQYNKKMSPQPRPTVPGPEAFSNSDHQQSKTQSTESTTEPKTEAPSKNIPEAKKEKSFDIAFQTTVVGSPQTGRSNETTVKKAFSKQSKSEVVLATVKQVPSSGYTMLSMSMPQLPNTQTFIPVQFCSAPSTTIQRTSSLSALQRPSVGLSVTFSPITKIGVGVIGSGAFTPVAASTSSNELTSSSGAFGKSKSLSNLLSKKPPKV